MRLLARNLLVATSIVVSLAMISALATGCSLLGGEPELQTLTESNGFYHIEVPADWSGASEQGLIVATDAPEMPADVEAIDTFWLLIYHSNEATTVPVAEYLPQLLEARAQERGWQDPQYGDVEEAQVGGRPAVAMTASGLDASGTAFEGRYTLVRTTNRDIIIAAIAPQGELADYSEQLDSILLDHWFWHQPESEESSGTAGE